MGTGGPSWPLWPSIASRASWLAINSVMQCNSCVLARHDTPKTLGGRFAAAPHCIQHATSPFHTRCHVGVVDCHAGHAAPSPALPVTLPEPPWRLLFSQALSSAALWVITSGMRRLVACIACNPSRASPACWLFSQALISAALWGTASGMRRLVACISCNPSKAPLTSAGGSVVGGNVRHAVLRRWHRL